jgi:hypothetical protein
MLPNVDRTAAGMSMKGLVIFRNLDYSKTIADKAMTGLD